MKGEEITLGFFITKRGGGKEKERKETLNVQFMGGTREKIFDCLLNKPQ